MNKLIVSLVALQILTACYKTDEAEIFLIPENYSGKVNIIFNQKSGLPIKYEGNNRVYEIPANGILITQFTSEYGLIQQTFYFVDSLGKRKRIEIKADENQNSDDSNVYIFRSGSVGVYGDSRDTNSLQYQEFFVSSRKNFDSYFNRDYTDKFEEKIKKLTGYIF